VGKKKGGVRVVGVGVGGQMEEGTTKMGVLPTVGVCRKVRIEGRERESQPICGRNRRQWGELKGGTPSLWGGGVVALREKKRRL